MIEDMRIWFLWIMLTVVLTTKAQTVVSGVVTDRQTGRVLSNVSVTAEGGHAHTVTNEDGRFTLKLQERPKYVVLSHIGYQSYRQPIGEGPTD